MYFYDRVIFRAISAMVILLGSTSCTQDPMIRINSISSIELVPNQEIRYKACGENSANCQEIFKNINNKKAELREVAEMNHEIYKSNKNKIIYQERWNELEKCNTVIQRFPSNESLIASQLSEQELANKIKMCQERVGMAPYNTPAIDTDENYSKPTEDDIKKVTKEVITASLNEYTFAKSDGSIVVICPTRYCAIASADGAWIGIGARNKPNELVSLILN